MSIDDHALAFLQAGGVLTPAVGEEKWRCLAVHSLVSRLRERGHTITCKRQFDRQTRRTWGEYRYVAPVTRMPTEQLSFA